jgi:hypothetical protein
MASLRIEYAHGEILVGLVLGMVVFNLEPQKVMDRLQSIAIFCLNPNPATVWQFFKGVGNRIAFFLHHRNAGRNLAVDEHRQGEVAVREHRDNVRQMRPDRLHVLGVLAVLDGYFNVPAVRVEAEMMFRLVMRESHHLIAVFFRVGPLLRRLHMFFVHGAGLHVLRCHLQPAE